MATAPIGRDQQIELMKAARARHIALTDELRLDAEIQAVLRRKPSNNKTDYLQRRESVKIPRCG